MVVFSTEIWILAKKRVSAISNQFGVQKIMTHGSEQSPAEISERDVFLPGICFIQNGSDNAYN